MDYIVKEVGEKSPFVQCVAYLSSKFGSDGLRPLAYAAPMNRIRELREARGMTGEQLARAIGTTSATIYKLERGDRRLTADWMEKIAAVLRCTIADLVSNVVL